MNWNFLYNLFILLEELQKNTYQYLMRFIKICLKDIHNIICFQFLNFLNKKLLNLGENYHNDGYFTDFYKRTKFSKFLIDLFAVFNPKLKI